MRVMILQQTKENEAIEDIEKVKTLLKNEGYTIETLKELGIPPHNVNHGLWLLAKRLEKMAEADAVYFMDGIDCDFWDVLERQACSEHGVEAMRNISFSKADTSKDTFSCSSCGAPARGRRICHRVYEDGVCIWAYQGNIEFFCDEHAYKFSPDIREKFIPTCELIRILSTFKDVSLTDIHPNKKTWLKLIVQNYLKSIDNAINNH